jgi:hypothetical protein
MFRTKCLLLPFVLLALTATFFAQSHPGYSANRKNFKIAGNAVFGYSMTMGDFSISGVGYQVLPQGPSVIGECTVNTDCTLYLFPYPASGFCMYCRDFSGGVFLDQTLMFTLTAFYPGGDTLKMHVNVAGTVTEYPLINCDQDGHQCELGPASPTVRISGHGTADVSMMYTPGDITTLASGATIAFSGVAHVEDTP